MLRYFYWIRSLITSPARIRPATDGTKATLPGRALLPSGNSSSVSAVGSEGMGSSVENSTFRCRIPRLAHSLRMIRAKGHTEVLVISAIWNRVGSSLLPVPMQLIMGVPFIACGPFIKRGVVVEHADLIDGAPTYAKILGVALPLADGSAIEELLDSDKLT